MLYLCPLSLGPSLLSSLPAPPDHLAPPSSLSASPFLWLQDKEKGREEKHLPDHLLPHLFAKPSTPCASLLSPFHPNHPALLSDPIWALLLLSFLPTTSWPQPWPYHADPKP